MNERDDDHYWRHIADVTDLRAEVERLRGLLTADQHSIGWMAGVIEAHSKFGYAKPWCLCGEWNPEEISHHRHVATVLMEGLQREADDAE